MADETRKAVIEIASTFDGKGTEAAVAAQEKLTNTGVGLATQLPDLNAKTQAYTISTEAEYLAIQKAHNALAARIPVLQAAGKDTAIYEQSLANLSQALSTESALLISEQMENKAVAAAKAEAAEATKAEAAAQLEESEATKINTTAMREQLVILRELMAGRTSRIPGSLSILAGQYGLGGSGFTTGIMAATVAFFAMQESIEGVERASKAADEALKILEEGFGTADIMAMRKAWEEAEVSEIRYWADLRKNAEDYAKDQAQRDIDTAKENYEASTSATSAAKDVSLAMIEDAEKRGVITHAQALAAKYQLDVEYEQKKIQLMKEEDAAELAAKEAELTAKQNQLPAAVDAEQKAFQKAQKDAEDAAAHNAQEAAFQKSVGKGNEAMAKSGVNTDDAEMLREAAESVFGADAVKGKSLSDIAHMMRTATRGGTAVGQLTGAGVSFADAWDISGMFRSSVLGGRSLSDANFAAYEGGEKEAATAQAALNKYQQADVSVDPNVNPAIRAAQSKGDLDDAHTAVRDLIKSIQELQQEISTTSAGNAAKEGSMQEATTIGDIAGAIQAGTAPSKDTIAALIAEATDAKATAEQHQAAVAALRDSLAYLGSSAKDINTIVNGLMTHAIDTA